MADRLHPLAPEQARASRPTDDVWLSASAGTGKTQVLTARVLRLLLNGARPEGILCLTFTKAGASEMQERIHDRLGTWVTMKSPELATDLKALGEDYGPEAQRRARTLFADLLDARGSGLRVQTIHAFCQSLLGAFPAEADLIPGFRAIEDREQEQLRGVAMAEMIAQQPQLIPPLQSLSLDPGEESILKMLARCAASPDAMERLGSDVRFRVRDWLGLGDIDVEAHILAQCSDEGIDRAALRHIAALASEWNTKTGDARAEEIAIWLHLSPQARADALPNFIGQWSRKDGGMKVPDKGMVKLDPAYPEMFEAQYVYFTGLIELRALAALADQIVDALTIGQAFCRHYAEAKRRAGAVDFDDLIRATVGLLATSGMGEWIRYKLDQQTDHILIDEAQDTNARQWDIVKALAEEFYAGSGARGDAIRTLFTVGDYKQAIFGFQGTDPREFGRAQDHFTLAAQGVDRALGDLSLSTSYRSGQPVLDMVDATIAGIGHEAFGLDRLPPRHVAHNKGGGQVTVWKPVTGAIGHENDDDEEGWLSDAELAFASQLAKRVRDWTQGGLTLHNKGRPARPEDVLILVRNRGEMARLIVSRLHEEGVPVAGVDRLNLAAPIAVQDLLACIRFVLQPDDDLNLASLLVSPLIGWSQDDLYARAKAREKMSLWQHLGDTKPPALVALLGQADLATPYRFLEGILSGQMQGRKRLIARLGGEARDPVAALLNAALEFERDAPPALQAFLDWFERGNTEIKRDAGKAENAVRVMTVHGAKGLQAPIVVLADATHDFDRKQRSGLDWQVGDLTLPLFRPRKAVRRGPIALAAETSDARELQEHWRLLYVAMTRAEEYLFAGGALKPSRAGKELGPNIWHARIADAMRAAGAEVDEEGTLVHGGHGGRAKHTFKEALGSQQYISLPDWIDRPAPVEARPPRPLAPSAPEAEDRDADPPPTPGMRSAAERGRWLHALFERLPAVPPSQRAAAADRWLMQVARIDNADMRAELAAVSIGIISDSAFAAVFSPEARAEAPVAGVVEGRVIAGTVDRLLVNEDSVWAVDFKTGRRVPVNAGVIPEHHAAQMAAYTAVLKGIFPDKMIRAGLLYTSAPKLLEVPPELLDRYKPGYREQHN